MQFNKDELSVFIDPSYFCSGICAVTGPTLQFEGISRAESKRDLVSYFKAALDLKVRLRAYLESLLARYSYVSRVKIVMEAPFPRGMSSPGLYLLQGMYLEVIREFQVASRKDTSLPSVHFYSLSPSYISAQIKKVCDKKDSVGIRKKWCTKVLDEEFRDWTIEEAEQLKEAGDDRQTAFGFYYFLSRSDKILEDIDL